jgi:hypothetical protein
MWRDLKSVGAARNDALSQSKELDFVVFFETLRGAPTCDFTLDACARET